MTSNKKFTMPLYSSLVYQDRYTSMEQAEKLDNKFSANLRTFFQYNTLVESALKNIKMNQSVLQLGITFGNQMDMVAQTVGAYGQYDILDISAFQVARNKENYGNVYPCMNFC